MLVSQVMTRSPRTIDPEATLADARELMEKESCRHLPVVRDGDLVGVLTDRDVRERPGFENQVRTGTAMSQPVVTASANDRVEVAARVMVDRRVGGLPVVDGNELVGMITYTDILASLCDMIDASSEDTFRIVLDPPGPDHDLTAATSAIAEGGFEVLSVGTYTEKESDRRVFYVTARGQDLAGMKERLAGQGYEVLAVHS